MYHLEWGMMFLTAAGSGISCSSFTSNNNNYHNIVKFHLPILPPATNSSSSCITLHRGRSHYNYYHNHIQKTYSSIVADATSSASNYYSIIVTAAAAAAAAAAVQPQTFTSQPPPIVSPYPRRLILLRHAHSSWPKTTTTSLRDHDRPLSEAGEADAIKVSQKLHQLGWLPELILSSDAVRTRETLMCMQDKVREFSEAEVHFISSFYSIAAMDGQTAQHLQEAICKYARDETLTVMCMGHNRGWEEAASMLSGTSIELKTCNAALLEASGKSWEEAFSLAGFGGWKLQLIIKPDSNVDKMDQLS